MDNERATPNDEFMALSQEIRFPFNNKLRLATDLINLSGLTDISRTDLINLSGLAEISN